PDAELPPLIEKGGHLLGPDAEPGGLVVAEEKRHGDGGEDADDAHDQGQFDDAVPSLGLRPPVSETHDWSSQTLSAVEVDGMFLPSKKGAIANPLAGRCPSIPLLGCGPRQARANDARNARQDNDLRPHPSEQSRRTG